MEGMSHIVPDMKVTPDRLQVQDFPQATTPKENQAYNTLHLI